MKTHKYLSTVLFVFLTIGSSFAFASGGATGVGGGGDVVILPSDEVVLADPFLDYSGQQPDNMPPMRALNPRLLQTVNAYLSAAVGQFRFFSASYSLSGRYTYINSYIPSDIETQLIALKTRNSDLRFYAVQSEQELNTYCATGGKKLYKLPEGHLAQKVACTSGSETFVVEPLFVRLSLRNQALLLIHERLTTLRDKLGGKNYAAIARVTTGLNLFLDLYREQTVNQKFRKLSQNEVGVLTNFYIGIEEIEKRNSEIDENSFQWTAHSWGGGKVHARAFVDENTIIGIGSIVGSGSTISEGAKLNIMNSELNQIAIKFNIARGAVLDNVVIENINTFELGRDSYIKNSKITGDQSGSIQVTNNQKMQNGILNSESKFYYSQNDATPKPIRLSYKTQIPNVLMGTIFNDRTDGNTFHYTFDDIGASFTFSGSKKFSGRGMFSMVSYFYDFVATSVKVVINAKLQKADLKGLYTINEAGELAPASYKKYIMFDSETIGRNFLHKNWINCRAVLKLALQANPLHLEVKDCPSDHKKICLFYPTRN